MKEKEQKQLGISEKVELATSLAKKLNECSIGDKFHILQMVIPMLEGAPFRRMFLEFKK